MRRLHLDSASAYRPDDNVRAYRPEEDGRNASGERVQYVALRLVHPSRHQTRVTSDPEADRMLADDIDANGLTHVPLLRHHSERLGEYEIVAGHRRIAALRRLAREGRGAKVLRGDADEPEERRIPAVVRELDDVTAQIMTVGENILREDLRPWEQALALDALRRSLETRGEPASVRGLAAYLEVRHQTIAPYLRVARALTPGVLRAAGLVSRNGNDEPVVDVPSLCMLSLAALERAARPMDPEERASALRAEIVKARGRSAAPREQRCRATEPAGEPAASALLERGFQINIRRPLRSLDPDQARLHLKRLAAAVGLLLDVACAEEKVLAVPLDHSRTLLLRIEEVD